MQQLAWPKKSGAGKHIAMHRNARNHPTEQPPKSCRRVQLKQIKWPSAKSQAVLLQFDTDEPDLGDHRQGKVDWQLETIMAISQLQYSSREV